MSMSMDSLEKLNSAMRLTESRKEQVEKAMHSLLAEWKNLEETLDSSTLRSLKDCFTDIQSREAQLDEVKQSMTRSHEVVNEIRESLERRMEEVERKEKEVGDAERRVEEKRREVEGVFERFGEEKRGLEGIREGIEERFEVVRVKERTIESREVKLEAIGKNLAEREERVAVREERVTMMGEVIEKRIKGIEMKEKGLKERDERIDKREREFDVKNVLSKERCKGVEIREKKLEDRLKQFELKEKRLKEMVEEMDLKNKEIELKNLSCEERCRRVERREKKLDDQMKEFESKEMHFREWAKAIDLKKKEVDTGRILNEERCKKLDLMEKNHNESLTEFKLKEQQFEARIKIFEKKEKEVDSIRLSCEERCRKFELEKEKLEDQMKESEMKKKQLSNVDHSIVKPEPCSVDVSFADIRFSITMGGKNLLLYIISRKRDLDSMTDEVFRALRMSLNPGKLVLDAMQDFYLIIEDKEFEADVVCKSSNLLLEQLRRISTQIQPRLKKAATELAHKWENKMKSSGEVAVFLNLLASYGLGTAFNPEEFLSLFEVYGQHIQISELCQLLGYTKKISDCIQVLLKKQQHVKAVRYVCAFGLRNKFQPASLLKDLMKNAEEASKMLRDNRNCQVDQKVEAIDNILASLREAVVCISQHKLESEYSPEYIGSFINQLIQQKEDEKVRLSASNNDKAKEKAAKNHKSATVVPNPTEGCITQLKANSPVLDSLNALTPILSEMDGVSLLLFLSENSVDHELLGNDVLNVLKSSREPAQLVLHAIQPPHMEMGDKKYDSPLIMRSCILLFEQLMKLSIEIDQQVKEDAIKLAFDWKTRMKTPLQVLGFLYLISTYGLDSKFEVSELERHFESVSDVKHSPQLCQLFRSSDKRPNQTTTSSICDWHWKNPSGLEMSKKEDDKSSFIHSANLAKLVLDAIRNCYYSNLNGKRIVKSDVFKYFIVMLEKLLTISPQIQPHVKKKAAKFAFEWKAQLLDVSIRKPTEVFGFFNLLAVYKVASSVDCNELLGLLDSIYFRKRVPHLIRLLGLAYKIPDFVESLIQKGDRLQAIRYISEFELVGSFPPVPILKDYLSSKNVMDISHIPKGNMIIICKQIAIRKEVVKCIKDCQLEAEFPPENLLAEVQKLEELAQERFQAHNDLKKNVSGPYSSLEAEMHLNCKRKQPAAVLYPSPEAQMQWHINKHPRFEPPVGTSLRNELKCSTSVLPNDKLP